MEGLSAHDGSADDLARPSVDALVLDGAVRLTLSPEQDFTLGRSASCDHQLDASDRAISRQHVRFRFSQEQWWIDNLSQARPVHVIDEFGLSTPLACGSSRVVDRAALIVQIPGEVFTHVIAMSRPSLSAQPLQPTGSLADPDTLILSLTDLERAAAASLCEGYLQEPPRHDPNPRTYAEIADRLGVPRSTALKRVESIRSKLVRAGVPGLLYSPDARRQLAEYLLAARQIQAADLTFLDVVPVD